MKKLLVLLFVGVFAISAANAAENQMQKPVPTRPANMIELRKAREAAFEKKLGLTEEQKAQARELRIKGHEKMKPIMDQIRDKKKEAEMVKMSRIAIRDQEARLAVIDAELKKLEKQAMEIRKSNFKEFESILTREQKRTLKQMKKEGKQRFKAEHHK